MKKLTSLAIVLIMLFISVPPFTALALTFSDFDYVVENVQINGETIPQVTITAYTGNDKQVYIPSIIENTKVTTIGEQAFADIDTVENVYLSDNVTKISSWAFSECDNLLTVNVPASVTTIGENAFDSLNPEFAMLVWNNSFAHTYAISNKINNKVIDTTTTLTVTFDGVPQNVIYGSSAIAPKTPTKKGYKFTGWSTTYDNIMSDLNITSTWTANQYTISFNTNGGKNIDDKEFLYNTASSKFPVPTKTGFIFSGWYTDKDLKNKLSTVSKSQTVYAKWTAGMKVTFKDGSKTLKTQTVSKSKKVTSYTPTKSGYKFAGWYTTSSLKTKFNFNSAITKNTTVYAKWTKISSNMTLEQITNKYLNSCVKIATYDSKKNAIATGSGFMISHNKKIQIVTNFHVIEDAYYVYAELENGTTYSLNKVYTYDKKNDVAVLTPSATIKNARPIPLGDTSKVSVGSACVAIGSPAGLKNTVSTGLISQKRTDSNKTKMFQISTQIAHGSSGGALFNMKGEVIGITSSGMEDVPADINFAIYIDYLKNALKKPVNKSIPSVTGATKDSGSGGGASAGTYDVWEGTEIPIPQEGDYDDYQINKTGTIITLFYKPLNISRYAKYVEQCGFSFFDAESIGGSVAYYYVKGKTVISFSTLSDGTGIIMGTYKK